MATSDDLSTLMVLAGVLETPGVAEHAARIADNLSSDWAKDLGASMIAAKEAGAAIPAESISVRSAVAKPSRKASAVARGDMNAVRQLAGLGSV